MINAIEHTSGTKSWSTSRGILVRAATLTEALTVPKREFSNEPRCRSFVHVIKSSDCTEDLAKHHLRVTYTC